MRRVPVRLGVFLPVMAGPGWLEPGVRVGVDWLFISNSWPGRATDQHTRTLPGAELVLAFRVNLTGRLFARLGVSGGAAIPYDVELQPDPGVSPTPVMSQHVFGQPRFYVKSGLELGFSFQ